jgi:uncharacterized protein YicC (UPF0701 family)
MGTLMSMTGFAREGGALADGTAFVWELRSVNGRGLDLRLRLPPGQDALEPLLREAAGRRLKRGNVSANLSLKREERPRLVPDRAALDQALELAQALAARIPGAAPPRAEALLALPGVMRSEAPEADEAAEEARRGELAAAFAARSTGWWRRGGRRATRCTASSRRCWTRSRRCTRRRARGGRPAGGAARALHGAGRRPARRGRRGAGAGGAAGAGGGDPRPALRRARGAGPPARHIDAARGMLRAGEGVGRKLDFLVQEFMREANTLCSKSASVALTRVGLDLKAAIERLREQAANVE